MSAPPYMPFYVGDYLADTTHLTTLEHGAYLLLLSTMWRAGGSLPADDAKLSRFARLTPAQWGRIKGTILSFFDMEDGEITQGRLTREMERHSKAVKQRRDSGSLGGKAKALKNNENAVAIATVSPKQPEPEPEPKKETEANASAKTIEPKARGTRLPDDWTPQLSEVAFAKQQGMTLEEITLEADKFRDFWCAKPGAGGRKSDWSATWRNWCRNRRSGAGVAGGARSGANRQGPADFASIIAERRGRAGV